MGHRACTFFGHRDCSASVRPRLREVLVELVEHYEVDMFYWTLQRAGFVVAYVLRPWGGAAQFVGLARRKGKEVWNLAFPGDFSCSEQRKSVL